MSKKHKNKSQSSNNNKPKFSVALQSELEKILGISNILMRSWLEDASAFDKEDSPELIFQKVAMTTAALALAVEVRWQNSLPEEGQRGQVLLQAAAVSGSLEACCASNWFKTIAKAGGDSFDKPVDGDNRFRIEAMKSFARSISQFGVNFEAVKEGVVGIWRFSFAEDPKVSQNVLLPIQSALLRTLSARIDTQVMDNTRGRALKEIAKKIVQEQGFGALVDFAQSDKNNYIDAGTIHSKNYLASMLIASFELKSILGQVDGRQVKISVHDLQRFKALLWDPKKTKNKMGLDQEVLDDAKVARITFVRLIGGGLVSEPKEQLQHHPQPQALKEVGHMLMEFANELKNPPPPPPVLVQGSLKWGFPIVALMGCEPKEIAMLGDYAAYLCGATECDAKWLSPMSGNALFELLEVKESWKDNVLEDAVNLMLKEQPEQAQIARDIVREEGLLKILSSQSTWAPKVLDALCTLGSTMSGVSKEILLEDLRTVEGIQSMAWKSLWLKIQESALLSNEASANLGGSNASTKLTDFLDDVLTTWTNPDGVEHTKKVVGLLKNNAQKIESQLEQRQILDVLSKSGNQNDVNVSAVKMRI